MPDCELSIEFDEASRVYKAGQMVTGRVIVQADEDVTCNGLDVLCGWETHGKGDKDKGLKDKQTVFTGVWTRGQRFEYSFGFELPPGPVSYHGELVNVDWYIQARADVPWAFDPKCEEDFLVEVATDPTKPVHVPEYNPGQSNQTKNAGPITLLIIALMTWGVSGGCAYWWYTSGDCFPIVFGGAAGLFALIVTVGGINAMILKRHVGNIVVALEPPWAGPGQTTTCLITLRPNKPTVLNGVKATLTGSERATYSQGTDRVTARHELYEIEIDLHGPADLKAGQLFEVQGEIAVPPDASYSFNGDNNSVAWLVDVDIDIKGLPDWSDKYELTVTY